MMAQSIKVLATKSWQSESNPQEEKEKLDTYVHTHTHIIIIIEHTGEYVCAVYGYYFIYMQS